MEYTSYSPQHVRKRKMLLVFPLLILPFITLAFWALGGGKASHNENAHKDAAGGLNLQLPNSKLKEEDRLNKLSYYEIAAADSAKWKTALRNDPYLKMENLDPYNETETPEVDSLLTDVGSRNTTGLKPGPGNALNMRTGAPDPNEERVYKKLQQLNAALENTATLPVREIGTGQNEIPAKQPAVNGAAVDKLERVMQTVQQTGNPEDTEMQQINGMLDKIMDIQHPERLSEKYAAKQAEQKETALAVKPVSNGEEGFYGLEEKDTTGIAANAVLAVVHETQTLVNGAIVKLRLLQDVMVSGRQIACGSLIYGMAALSGERLFISISSIFYKNSLYPVSMLVYDLDGMPGIYVPGVISRDVSKQSVDNALQSVVLSSLDPSIGAQAAGAGIETAKNLISKKVKLVRVRVKAGYRVLLADRNNN